MSDKTIDLYELLPVLYRLRDAERGHPLRALLEIVSKQADLVRQDIDGLWDDFFIETCADWVIPYIGDLVGNNPLHEAVRRRRADVAKTIYYRRRKGSLPMLEELARDVTGWRAHAVAFFELLGWTQNLNHQRYQMAPNPTPRVGLDPTQWKWNPNAVDRVGTINLRTLDALDRLDGPFDRISHSVDVRPMSSTEGWYNIRNIGFFLWRLTSYPMVGVEPRRSDDYGDGYHFSPLGNPIPLFNNPTREADETGLATELHVPGPIRPVAFFEMPEDYYGAGLDKSLAIFRRSAAGEEEVVPLSEIVCRDLSTWSPPGADEVAVDVSLGRLAFARGASPAGGVRVAYHYGFSADIGGGPYDRRDTLAPVADDIWVAVVARERPDPEPPVWSTIQGALDAWRTSGARRAVITVADNGTYTAEAISLALSDEQHLVIQAQNGRRPLLRFLNDDGELAELLITGGAGRNAALQLNGLLVEGGIRVAADSLGRLELAHCTLVPGRALDETGRPVFPGLESPIFLGLESIVVEEPNTSLEVILDHSITGPLWLPSEITALTVRDSILDALPGQAPAFFTPALVSRTLPSPFETLTSEAPRVLVTIGEEGPHLAVFPNEGHRVEHPEQARRWLEEAIQAAHPSPAFRRARVLTDHDSNRLIIVPGMPAPVRIQAASRADAEDPDPTAEELHLTPDAALEVQGLVGEPLPEGFRLRAEMPRMTAAVRAEEPVEVELDRRPDTPARARDQIRAALLAAPSDNAWVELIDFGDGPRLFVASRTGDPITFRAAPDDPYTVLQLGLVSDRLALAIGDAGDEAYGPPTTLERVTVFGTVRVKQLTLASEVIFTEVAMAQRRQVGCVRFSYVPDVASQTPRRYCCQPDLALEAMPASAYALVRSRLRPAFTSVYYGDPGYAQLSQKSAKEICAGAEDGAEMGAFHDLMQPQRETNLRIRLEEYLPFGLEAGLIHVT